MLLSALVVKIDPPKDTEKYIHHGRRSGLVQHKIMISRLTNLETPLLLRDIKVMIKITNLPLKEFIDNRKKGDRPVIARI